MLRTDDVRDGGVAQSTASATTASGALKMPLSCTFWRKSLSQGSVQFFGLRARGSSRRRWRRAGVVGVVADVGHVVRVLAPERARADPRVGAVAEARRGRGTTCWPPGPASSVTPLIGVRRCRSRRRHFQPPVLGSTPFETMSISACPSPSMSASIDASVAGERRVRRSEAHGAGRPVEDPEPALVGVDDSALPSPSKSNTVEPVTDELKSWLGVFQRTSMVLVA